MQWWTGLDSVLDAVAITPSGYVYWFGERVSVPSDGSGVRLKLQQATRDLASVLYDCFYTTGHVLPLSRDADELSDDKESLTAALSRANSGTGSRERGWSAVTMQPTHAIVRRRGLTVTVPRRSVQITGSRAAVTGPREMLNVSPGFYFALGNLLPAARVTVRVYWNVSREGAVPFISEITRCFNERNIPFRAKVANDVRAYGRADTAVLYLAKSDMRRAYPLLRTSSNRLRAHVRPAVPAFTKRVAPGIAIAESPVGGKSFGQSRCSILADGLMRAFRDRSASRSARRAHIFASFKRNRVLLETPYLNFGSVDVYPPIDDSD